VYRGEKSSLIIVRAHPEPHARAGAAARDANQALCSRDPRRSGRV
jgi:hypothetical protein